MVTSRVASAYDALLPPRWLPKIYSRIGFAHQYRA